MAARRFAMSGIIAVRTPDINMPEFAAMCVNVSATGMLLSVPHPMPIGTSLELWMVMPAAIPSAAFPIRYTASVIRSEVGPDGPRVAVKFTSVEILRYDEPNVPSLGRA